MIIMTIMVTMSWYFKLNLSHSLIITIIITLSCIKIFIISITISPLTSHQSLKLKPPKQTRNPMRKVSSSSAMQMLVTLGCWPSTDVKILSNHAIFGSAFGHTSEERARLMMAKHLRESCSPGEPATSFAFQKWLRIIWQ